MEERLLSEHLSEVREPKRGVLREFNALLRCIEEECVVPVVRVGF